MGGHQTPVLWLHVQCWGCKDEGGLAPLSRGEQIIPVMWQVPPTPVMGEGGTEGSGSTEERPLTRVGTQGGEGAGAASWKRQDARDF